jgi:purine-nucleoside phosphorylase
MDTSLKNLAQSQLIKAATAFIQKKLQGRQPVIGIVLGSGLGKLADEITDPIAVPYGEVEGFPVSTAIGHKGNFIVGNLGGKCVIAMQGRIHYYEGYEMATVTLPIRVMIALGIKYLFVSNAAGGTNLSYHVGDLMIIKDHINMLPNPLIGPNLDEFGPRFPDMTRPYDPALIRKAEALAEKEGIALQKGVYVAVSGPCYETPAEYRYFRAIGADAVGMSTVPEVIIARHSNIPVFGMSVITDVAHATDDEDYVTDGEAIVKAADAAADKMTLLFTKLIAEL